MKIVYICINDWANYGYDQCEALKSIGADAKIYKLNSHPFNYYKQAQVVNITEMADRIKEADYINFIHGEIPLYNMVRNLLAGKKVGVTYTGSAYRNSPNVHNIIFNNAVDFSFTDQCEFINLGSKNIHYVATAVKDKEIKKFGHEIKKPYKVGHFPSNPEVKGTQKILQMLNIVQGSFELRYSTEIVSHDDQYKRMNDCDIYIELFKPELAGRPYGCFGVTAFEAAAAGKIVITQNINDQVYREAYGACPFAICNDEYTFIKTLEALINHCSPLDISTLQTETYEIVMKNHSYNATAHRILNIIS